MSKMLKVVGASWLRTKISSYVLGILGVLAILALFAGQIERIQGDGNFAVTVFHTEKTGYRIEFWGQSNELADVARGVARAYFRKDMDSTGWSLLEIETDGSYDDEVQAYAAGIIEGALTWSLIQTHLENNVRPRCEDDMDKQCGKLRDALEKSYSYWSNYAQKFEHDPYWHHVSLYYTQLRGVLTGWKHGIQRNAVEYEADIDDLLWLNALGDITEIQRLLNITLENNTLSNLPSLSSAFVRLVNGTAEDAAKKLYVAHNAAGSYSSMNRILKRYKLNYHLTKSKGSGFAPGSIVEFSGYPGCITSQDEFYLLKGEHRDMVVTGTPLRNYNTMLWKNVNVTDQMPIGPRVTAANHLSRGVRSWGHVIAANTSGAAGKQWLVLDYARFRNIHWNANIANRETNNETVTVVTVFENVRHKVVHRPSRGQAKGVLELVEQVPGLTHSADLTDILLQQGYWATHGLPFFDDVAKTTHVNVMEEKHGDVFSENKSPRARAFRNGYENATSVDAILELMRGNNVTAINSDEADCTDEVNCILGEGGYWAVLGVRGDIVNNYKEAYGVIDTKVVSGTSNNDALELTAISGPPYTDVSKKNTTDIPLNKATVTAIYTDRFNNQPQINGLEIRDLVKQEQEEAEERSLELLNKDIIKPFQWSDSDFKNVSHASLPDKWEFTKFKPTWSW